MTEILLEASSISLKVPKPDGHDMLILDHIDFKLESGEIVAILGKSGSGKSTFLRIIAGLTEPTQGKIKPHYESSPDSLGISMIFQSFALFPWMTVLENVEIGLEAMSFSAQERRTRASKAIDIIGLDGFQSAYPRELSGGMKQRVGFARAFVVNPQILLMDEPFSALDVLTSNNLKQDFLNLWVNKSSPIKSVVIVTHGIEEAVSMADRVVIFGSSPGHIVSELKINLPRPRDHESPSFKIMVDKIYKAITIADKNSKKSKKTQHKYNKLPFVTVTQLIGITEALNLKKYDGKLSMSELVKMLNINATDIFRAAEVLILLKFGTFDGNLKLNKSGKLFAQSDTEKRKKLFAKHLISNIELIAYIIKAMNKSPKHSLKLADVKKKLESNMQAKEVQETIKTLISWGRYSEIFSYHAHKKIFQVN